MTTERLQELLEIFCDADRRGRLTDEEREKYSPSIGEIEQVLEKGR